MAKFKLKKGKTYNGFKDGKRHKYGEGDIIDIDPDRIKYMMDFFDPLEPIETESKRHAAPRTQLKAVDRDDGKYDVISVPMDVPINDVPLTKKEARTLIDGKNLAALEEGKIEKSKKEEIKKDVKEKVEEPAKEEKPDEKGTDTKDLAKGNGVHTRRRSKSK